MSEDQRAFCREKRTPFLILGSLAKPTHAACLSCKKGSLEGSQRGDPTGFLHTHSTGSPSCTEKWPKVEKLYRSITALVSNTISMAPKKRVVTRMVAKTAHKTLSMEEWKATMPELYAFIVDKVDPSVKANKMTIVQAPVKSGKRKMVECLASYTTPVGESPVVHFFASSFVRRADDEQREELHAYLRGGDVLMINSDGRTGIAIDRIKRKVEEGYRVILHFDELDYGSHYESLMSRLYYYFQNQQVVKYILYSATVEEAVAHKQVVSEESYPCEMIQFTPPSSFCGPRWFLERNLVHDCELPFDKESGTFGRQFLDQIVRYRHEIRTTETNRRIVVVRVPDLRAVKGVASTFPPELTTTPDFCIAINYASSVTELRDMEIMWGDYGWWKSQIERLRRDSLWIIFLEDTSTRSTDWFLHPWLRAYFDYHSETSCVNTRIQSGERVNFYKNKRFGPEHKNVYNGEEHRIDVFASVKVFQYSAGLIGVDKLDMPLTSRMIVSKTSQKWAIPVAMLLSDDQLAELVEPLSVVSGERIRSQIHALLLRFAKDQENAEDVLHAIEGKTLKYKRVYPATEEAESRLREDGLRGGIVTVARNYDALFPSQPGGGSPNSVLLDQYCIDVAKKEIPYTNAEGNDVILFKGIVFITYPTTKPEIDNGLLSNTVHYDSDGSIGTTNLHRTKKDSMFGNRTRMPSNTLRHV